jgi:hypothetical protein
MPLFDLTDVEHAELVRILRAAIAADRFPLAPRLRTLRAILDKLDPRPEPLPPPKRPGERSMAMAKKRRR